MSLSRLDDLPGYRRRFRIAPGPAVVSAWLEDDFHCMAVTLRHDGELIQGIEAKTIRAPWTTCPGAEPVLAETFVGASLAEAARRGLKTANCTHLYDLAVLAAAHSAEAGETEYEVLVTDPVEGLGVSEIRRDGIPVMRWTIAAFSLVEPAELAGRNLLQLRDWIEGLDPAGREAARILQWASIVAHGRQIPAEQQSDATRMPPNCYSFQPAMAVKAVRVGEVVDFSRSEREPLAQFRSAASGRP